MAIVKSNVMPWSTGGFNIKNAIRTLAEKPNITIKEYGDTIVICSRPQSIKQLFGRYQYQKDFFCYADKLYAKMTWGQRKMWLDYYYYLKKHGMKLLGYYKKKRKTHWKKKRWGYHNFALWVKLLWDNSAGEFFYDKFGARYLIDEITIKDGKVTAKGWIIHKEALKLLMERYNPGEVRSVR